MRFIHFFIRMAMYIDADNAEVFQSSSISEKRKGKRTSHLQHFQRLSQGLVHTFILVTAGIPKKFALFLYSWECAFAIIDVGEQVERCCYRQV